MRTTSGKYLSPTEYNARLRYARLLGSMGLAKAARETRLSHLQRDIAKLPTWLDMKA